MTLKPNRFPLLFLLGIVAACGGAIAGCGDDDVESMPPTGTDSGTATDGPGPGTDTGIGFDSGLIDARTDAADAGLLFTEYTKDLILNHTADNTTPDNVEAKTFLADPEDPSAFSLPANFFQ